MKAQVILLFIFSFTVTSWAQNYTFNSIETERWKKVTENGEWEYIDSAAVETVIEVKDTYIIETTNGVVSKYFLSGEKEFLDRDSTMLLMHANGYNGGYYVYRVYIDDKNIQRVQLFPNDSIRMLTQVYRLEE